ncbi:MAG TPA: FtsX-like permease family protein [Vicinamibacterales bacterium]|nr:FtsX-like permease family protein [Vicinamibacterales bacterium]
MAMLSELFGVTAALLVGIGLYGLLAYTVTRRVKEIGLRMAIGATARDVISIVLTSGLRLVSAGLIVGVPTALWMKSNAANALATVASTQAEAPIMPPRNTLAPMVIARVAIIGLALVASYGPRKWTR